MKKNKTSRGVNRFIKDFLKIMKKKVARKSTNNYRKMHGLSMRRSK